MEIIKYKANEVLYHIRHNIRELPPGKHSKNESINPALTKFNYSLISRGNAETVNKKRKEAEKHIFSYKRSDIVHALEYVIQCPDDVIESQRASFFRESFEYIASTLPRGKEDIFVAEVHNDEVHRDPAGNLISKPHVHIMAIPAVKDTKHKDYEYRLCADQLTKRSVLKKLHPEFQSYLNSRGIKATVYTKREGGGKTIALSVQQMKELTAKTGIVLKHSLTVNEFAKIINTNIQATRKVEALKSTIRNLQITAENRDKNIKLLQEQAIKQTKALYHAQSEIISAGKEKAELKNQLKEKELENQKLNAAEQRILSENKLKLEEIQKNIAEKELELSKAQDKIKELEAKQHEETWGVDPSWGSDNTWGTADKSHTVEEEILW